MFNLASKARHHFGALVGRQIETAWRSGMRIDVRAGCLSLKTLRGLFVPLGGTNNNFA